MYGEASQKHPRQNVGRLRNSSPALFLVVTKNEFGWSQFQLQVVYVRICQLQNVTTGELSFFFQVLFIPGPQRLCFLGPGAEKVLQWRLSNGVYLFQS